MRESQTIMNIIALTQTQPWPLALTSTSPPHSTSKTKSSRQLAPASASAQRLDLPFHSHLTKLSPRPTPDLLFPPSPSPITNSSPASSKHFQKSLLEAILIQTQMQPECFSQNVSRYLAARGVTVWMAFV
ncbi:hypothetical protein GYMLUDRAFT_257619 [Collybiopsis luxurians FD-317 M1]|nr:hypothetical protein GYMLUDRAFT_257619 [Collybiopsis luxurians FD-317 M1]